MAPATPAPAPRQLRKQLQRSLTMRASTSAPLLRHQPRKPMRQEAEGGAAAFCAAAER
jgi:hypothetical protein